MKLAGSLFIAAMLLLLLVPAAVLAEDEPAVAQTTDKPYATIVARNMFGLLPIPPPDTNPPAPPVDPPPKITPNGIMTIFGRDQALFKVAVKPKPGQPPKEDSYVLSEGERQDDIEVVKINHTDGIVTFNNHGTIQELPLVPTKDSGSGGGSGPGPGNPMGGIPRPGPMSPGERAASVRERLLGRSDMNAGSPSGNNFGNGGMGVGQSSSSGLAGFSLRGGNSGNPTTQVQNDPNSITPEQQVILMEAQRMKFLQEGNQARAALLPTTPLTQQNMNENGPPAP
jgi:hypothetical protein